jgi:hypothetical protein
MLGNRDALDTGTDIAGHPAYLKAGYWISGAGRILDTRPDIDPTFICLENFTFAGIFM